MAGDTVFIQGEGGGIFELSLPLHETIADKLAKGAVRRVQDADGTPYDESARPGDVPALPESRPSVNAPKAEWIGWAVKNGAGVADAEAASKADLIELYGARAELTDEEKAAREAAATSEAAEKVRQDALAAAHLGDNVDESESHHEGDPGEVVHNENRDGQGEPDDQSETPDGTPAV